MNPVTELPGPAFLFFYGCVISIVLVWARQMIRNSDLTRDDPPPNVPWNPDPYEIAYLQGGENEVARLAIFDLLESGHLERGADQTVQQSSALPSSARLSAIQRDVLALFAQPMKASDVFKHLSGPFAERCEQYKERLQDERLLCLPETKLAARRTWRIAAAIVLSLAAYRLVLAHSHGQSNVGFLIGMGVIATIALAVMCNPARISARGQAYLNQLKAAYGRDQVAAWLGGEATAPVLLASVFGAGALAGTPYAYYEELFPKKSKQHGGTCGVACGSDSGGGGGGCGGCGGGCGG